MFERIISFFSENIFFLFVIIGIISSLFGKEKKDTSKQKRPEFDSIPKPTAQPVQKRKVKEIKQVLEDINPQKIKEIKQVLEDVNPKKIKEIKHVLEDLNPKKVKEITSSAQLEIENEVSDTYQELLKQQERWEQEAVALEAKANSIKEANHVAIHSNAGLNAFHNNELVNGIIMSEVLGPPKSKQPFNRLKK